MSSGGIWRSESGRPRNLGFTDMAVTGASGAALLRQMACKSVGIDMDAQRKSANLTLGG